MGYWKNRRRVIEDFKEIGCGLLTVAFVSLPLWVMTIGWRGPVFAATSILLLAAAVALLIVVDRFLRRRRRR